MIVLVIFVVSIMLMFALPAISSVPEEGHKSIFWWRKPAPQKRGAVLFGFGDDDEQNEARGVNDNLIVFTCLLLAFLLITGISLLWLGTDIPWGQKVDYVVAKTVSSEEYDNDYYSYYGKPETIVDPTRAGTVEIGHMVYSNKIVTPWTVSHYTTPRKYVDHKDDLHKDEKPYNCVQKHTQYRVSSPW